MSYKAHYNGDANYPARDGACEPLAVSLPCPAGLFLAGTGAGNGPGDLNIAYDQFPAPNDNSYGVNAVGWAERSHLREPDRQRQGRLPDREAGRDDRAQLQHRLHHFDRGERGGSVRVRVARPVRRRRCDRHEQRAGADERSGEDHLGYGDCEEPEQDRLLRRRRPGDGQAGDGGLYAASAGAGTCSDLLVDSPKTLNTTDSYVLKTPNPWAAVYANPEYAAMNLTPSQQAQVVSTVNGWNFHDTFFVTLKQAYLTAIGFDFSNWTFGPSAVAGQVVGCAEPHGAAQLAGEGLPGGVRRVSSRPGPGIRAWS